MKKIYKNPTTLVVNLQSTSILTSSNDIPTATTSFKSGDPVLSRRRNTLWDDEEDY